MNKKYIKFIALAVALLLILAYCGLNRGETPEMPETPVTQPSDPTEVMTEAPALTEPEWTAGIIRADYAEGIYDILSGGTEVNVIGQFKDYFVIAGEKCDLLIEKRFVRMESEPAFEQWNAYARSGAEVFDSVYMREDPVAELRINTELTVLEGKGDWVYAKWTGGEGYMLKDRISKSYISTQPGSGGGSQPPKDGTDVDVGSLSHNHTQGGIVLLGAYYGPEQETGFEPGKGTVIADAVETYLILRQREDEVKVTGWDENICTIWVEEDLYVTVPRWLVRLEGDAEYESWSGYTSNGAGVFEEYQLRNEQSALTRNTVVTVLDEIPAGFYSFYHPGCYVVSIHGQIGYMAMDTVSETMFPAPSGSNGGGSSGSGDVWTPPAL